MSTSQEKKRTHKKSASFSSNNSSSSSRTRNKTSDLCNPEGHDNDNLDPLEIEDHDMNDENDLYEQHIFAEEDNDEDEDEEMADGINDSQEDDDDDDEEGSLVRLSEQYRTLSRSRSINLEYGEENDDDEGEDEDADLMGSIHRAGMGANSDDEDGDGEEDEDEENGDGEAAPDREQDMFHQAFAAFTGRRLNPGANPADSARSLNETIGRMFPDALMFDGAMRGNQISGLVDNLQQREDSYLLLETLNELSERLLMMNTLAERTIPAGKLSKNLIAIMQDPVLMEELELQLVACRCLYNLFEVNPDFCHEAINHGAIEVLCAKLFEVSYIDLAEQALQTLEMISRSNFVHNKIISKNGLGACLTYLDFFTIHAQRKALIIAANSCSNISLENFSLIKDIFPTLENVALNYTDSTVAENAWLAISRIIMSFRSRPDLLEELFLRDNNESQLFARYSKVIVNSSSRSNQGISPLALTFATCLNLIKSLIVLVGASVKISKVFILNCDIGEVIIQSLSKYSKPDSRSSANIPASLLLTEISPTEAITESEVPIEALMSAPKELILQLLNLICYLLPIKYSTKSTPFLPKGFQYGKARKDINEQRIESYSSSEAKPKFIAFVNHIWPLLINIYSCTVEYEVRRRVLINLMRIISFFDSEEDLASISKVKSITNLLASIVIQNKSSIKTDVELLDAVKEENEKDGRKTREENADSHIDENRNDHDHDIEEEEDEDDDDEEEEDNEDNEDEEIQEDNEGDDNEDDDNDEVEDSDGEDFRFRAHVRVNENISGLHTKILLLGALKLSQSLIDRSSGLFVRDFEREGLMSDTQSILNIMMSSKLFAGRKIDSEIDEAEENIGEEVNELHRFQNFANNFVDAELGKEYECHLSSNGILNDLFDAASHVVHIYSMAKSSTDGKIPLHMVTLNEATVILNDLNRLKGFSYAEWCSFWIRLDKAAFQSDLSSFELISCGIIEALLLVFKSDIGVEGSACFKSFTSVFFNFDKDDASITFLICKLQEALTRSESFEIISSGAYIPQFNTTSTTSTRTAAMVKQVKLKLISDDVNDDAINVEADANDLPDNLRQFMLSVHAIATFKTINTFLQSRIRILSHLTSRILNPQRVEKEADNSYIEFSINGELIPNGTTIYGAIYKSLQSEPDQIIDPQRIWTTAHIVKFRKVDGVPPLEGDEGSKYTNESGEAELLALNVSTTINVLQLLKVLFNMNSSLRSSAADMKNVSESIFLNWKLTAKLNRQLEEPLVVASGTLPGWSIHITRQFPFIFPLDTRIFFLQSTSFGYSRLIHTWQIRTNQETNETNQNRNNQAPQLGRPTRHKVRISRNQMFQSAIKVLNLYGTHPSVLEIEYFDEVGTGLGPTLEFYANVSKEFSRKRLKLWREDDDETNEYVNNKQGLFPIPMNKQRAHDENGRRILQLFSMLGKFVARGLLDSRIIDFRFNPLFFQIASHLNSITDSKSSKYLSRTTRLDKLKTVDEGLARSLFHLCKYIDQFKSVPKESREQIRVDDCTLEDLSLTFILPGYPDVELMENGEEIYITASNVEKYVDKVIDMTIGSGVQRQIMSFVEGFSKVFPFSSMIIFSPDESVRLFGSGEEDWSYETLESSIHANHGYNSESESIHTLLSIMCNFTSEEKRVFLQFLTGSPKLPIGGFKALRPELTVVRKHAEDGLSDDDYLPSVMTCANYLKLPNYSSKEIMKKRIIQAIYEGAGAFLLS